jgi:putative membrane protein
MIRITLLFLSCLFLGYNAATTPASSLGTAFAIMFLILIFLLTIIPLRKILGDKQSLLLFLCLSAFAIIFETIALKTGVPYGAFTYTGLIGTILPGGASWTIPLGWIPLVLSAYQLTQRVPRLFYRILGGTAFVCLFDLVIDPVATAMGYWHWQPASLSYYDVPLQNFAGWLISGALGLLIIYALIGRKRDIKLPPDLHQGTFLLMAFHVGATIAFNQWIATFFGIIVCALLSFELGWRNKRRLETK